jgi:hypothetical protein
MDLINDDHFYFTVWLFARALDKLISNDQDLTNGTLLYQTILTTSFTGLTGNVTMIGGDRVSTRYDLINLVVGQSNYVIFGSWDDRNGIDLIDEVIWPDGTTRIPVFQSVHYVPPPDYVYVEWDSPVVVILIILLAITAAVILGIIGVVTFFVRHSVFYHTSLLFHYSLLASAFVCCFMIYPFFGEPNDGACGVRPWTILPFLFFYGYVS